jgi:hypothetical protein
MFVALARELLRTVSGGSSNTILGACRRSTRPPVVIRAYFA